MNTYKIYKCELSEIQQIRLLKIIRNAQATVLLCGYKAEKRIDLYDAYLLPYGWKCCKLIKYATTASDGKRYMAEHYNLDVIISVSYRVKSKRGIEFRRWANCVLKEYIIRGYAVNHNRMNQLNEVIRVMKRAENSLDTKQVLTVVERYSQALELLDAYDHQNMERPKGNKATYILTYEECRKVIDNMKFGDSSSLFGNEKDESFKGSIGTIYQSFAGEDLYPTLEEKAANLLYFVTKNHSFFDGNKRIAATIFLYFYGKNAS